MPPVAQQRTPLQLKRLPPSQPRVSQIKHTTQIPPMLPSKTKISPPRPTTPTQNANLPNFSGPSTTTAKSTFATIVDEYQSQSDPSPVTIVPRVPKLTEPPPVATRQSSRAPVPNCKYTSLPHSLNAVLNIKTGKLHEYWYLIKGPDAAQWKEDNCCDIGPLYEGRSSTNTKVKGSKTIEWLHPCSIPKGRKSTYLYVCVNYRPQKADPYRIQ